MMAIEGIPDEWFDGTASEVKYTPAGKAQADASDLKILKTLREEMIADKDTPPHVLANMERVIRQREEKLGKT